MIVSNHDTAHDHDVPFWVRFLSAHNTQGWVSPKLTPNKQKPKQLQKRKRLFLTTTRTQKNKNKPPKKMLEFARNNDFDDFFAKIVFI